MRNEIVIEGTLSGIVPTNVYKVGTQLRVDTAILHHNEYTDTYFTVSVQSRGWLADKMLSEYTHGRNVVITGRLRPARYGSFKVITHDLEFGERPVSEPNPAMDKLQEKLAQSALDSAEDEVDDADGFLDENSSDEDYS
jgi:hypothetical protein